jgi:hypothetical protein
MRQDRQGASLMGSEKMEMDRVLRRECESEIEFETEKQTDREFSSCKERSSSSTNF